MKRLIKLAILFGLGLLAGAASAQSTTTYTGFIRDLSGALVNSGQVTFTLTPPTDATLLGISRFVPTTIVCTIQSGGTILNQASSGPCVVQSNTSLMPTGTAYKICLQPQYITPGSCFFDYAVTTSKDISTAIPTLGTGLLNYQGPSGPPGPAGPAGPAGPSGGVNSVFGRTGAVVSNSGDYTCSQITGAVCSGLALFYQTVQLAGAAQTQRPILNLISGTNASVTCADNVGNNSTDCTVAYSHALAIADVTASRAFGTTYTAGANDITVMAACKFNSGSGDRQISATVNGVSLPGTSGTSTIANNTISITFRVPAGDTYSVNCLGISGTPSLSLGSWVEWQ